MGKGLETLKNITKDKNKEKIIYILLAAVVILIASSYIFNGEDKKKDETGTIAESKKEEEKKYIYTSDELEQRLASIISKIEGISNVSCLITYKDGGTIVPLYTENKEVIYNEESSKKEIVIEKTLSPEIEGIIIVAEGFENPNVKSEVSTAVSSVMNIPAYKVQIFNKEVIN